MADVALNAIDKLEKENADLRTKLDVAENERDILKTVLGNVDIAKIIKERDELSAKIGEFEQYAELGRLVLNGNPCYFGYEYADGDCESVVCSENEKRVCKKRAELLAEGGE